MNDLLEHISNIYSLSAPVRESREVERGVLSVNKILSNSAEEFFLKQYRVDLAEEKIKEVHAVKKFFSDGGIPVIMPLQAKSGSTYFMFKDRMYALFPSVTGRHIERTELSIEAIKHLGAMLGRIHLRGREVDFTVHDTFTPWSKEKFLTKAASIEEKISTIGNKTDYDTQAAENIRLKKEIVEHNTKALGDFTASTFQLIHGDYHDGNVFFFKNSDDIEYVFDFEKAEMAPRAYELMRSMTYICLQSEYDDSAFGKAAHYLKSYHSIFPITQEELKEGIEVWYLKLAHSLWIEGEHYLNNNFRPDVFFTNEQKNLWFHSKRRDELFERLAVVIS